MCVNLTLQLRVEISQGRKFSVRRWGVIDVSSAFGIVCSDEWTRSAGGRLAMWEWEAAAAQCWRQQARGKQRAISSPEADGWCARRRARERTRASASSAVLFSSLYFFPRELRPPTAEICQAILEKLNHCLPFLPSSIYHCAPEIKFEIHK